MVTPVLRRDDGVTSDPAEAVAIRLGHAYIEALLQNDFEAIEGLFAPRVRFRALIPRAIRRAATAHRARAWIEDWFGQTEGRELIASQVEMVVDRLHVAYRLRLREDGTWHIVEQHLVGSLADGLLVDVALVCSGFRSVADSERAIAQLPVDARLDAIGRSCATLTPEIRAAVGQLQPGQVLEILADDPTAEEGLRAWTRLTGHELVEVAVGPAPTSRFYVRRRPSGKPERSTP
jgi:tRNA 2-thiouridine synthesizing protein A